MFGEVYTEAGSLPWPARSRGRSCSSAPMNGARGLCWTMVCNSILPTYLPVSFRPLSLTVSC